MRRSMAVKMDRLRFWKQNSANNTRKRKRTTPTENQWQTNSHAQQLAKRQTEPFPTIWIAAAVVIVTACYRRRSPCLLQETQSLSGNVCQFRFLNNLLAKFWSAGARHSCRKTSLNVSLDFLKLTYRLCGPVAESKVQPIYRGGIDKK